MMDIDEKLRQILMKIFHEGNARDNEEIKIATKQIKEAIFDYKCNHCGFHICRTEFTKPSI